MTELKVEKQLALCPPQDFCGPLPAFSLAHPLIPPFVSFLNAILDPCLQMFTYVYAHIVVWDPQMRKKVVFLLSEVG